MVTVCVAVTLLVGGLPMGLMCRQLPGMSKNMDMIYYGNSVCGSYIVSGGVAHGVDVQAVARHVEEHGHDLFMVTV